MSGPTAEQSEPRYVTCSCQHCAGNIEFDANNFEEGESCPLPCPHCGKETRVYAHTQRTPPVTPGDCPIVSTEADSPGFDQEALSLEVRLWRKQTAQGDAGAQWYLGMSYWTGRGVAEDHTEAVKWFPVYKLRAWLKKSR